MATTITIDNLDDGAFERLTSEARRLGTTPTAVAADVLRSAMSGQSHAGATPPLTPEQRRERIAALAGTWTDEDVREFDEATAPFREIDPQLWR